MSEESSGHTLDDKALDALLERPLTELSTNELMALKAAFAARKIWIYNSAGTEQMLLAFLAGNLGSPFLQALSQRAANGVADMSKKVTIAVRKHVKRNGHSDSTPQVELPENMSDETWLKLFDLVENGELYGKVLRWDEKVRAWRADD